MAAPLFTTSRYRNILIIAASILIVVGAGGGTILLLKHYAPVKMSDGTTTETKTIDVASLKKAEDLYAKGDYSSAKAEYQDILETYKAQNNEAGVKDIEMQLKVLDAAAKAPAAPQNTDKGRVTAGSQPE